MTTAFRPARSTSARSASGPTTSRSTARSMRFVDTTQPGQRREPAAEPGDAVGEAEQRAHRDACRPARAGTRRRRRAPDDGGRALARISPTSSSVRPRYRATERPASGSANRLVRRSRRHVVTSFTVPPPGRAHDGGDTLVGAGVHQLHARGAGAGRRSRARSCGSTTGPDARQAEVGDLQVDDAPGVRRAAARERRARPRSSRASPSSRPAPRRGCCARSRRSGGARCPRPASRTSIPMLVSSERAQSGVGPRHRHAGDVAGCGDAPGCRRGAGAPRTSSWPARAARRRRRDRPPPRWWSGRHVRPGPGLRSVSTSRRARRWSVRSAVAIQSGRAAVAARPPPSASTSVAMAPAWVTPAASRRNGPTSSQPRAASVAPISVVKARSRRMWRSGG